MPLEVKIDVNTDIVSDLRIKMDTCRICLEEDYISNMITPCSCCGTNKYVHSKCIDTWREMTLNPRAKHTCQQCNTKYVLKKQKLLPHTRIFKKYNLQKIFMIQYLFIIMSFFGYNLVFEKSYNHFNNLFRNFYFSVITIVGIEFLYCFYLWIFYVKERCMAFITVFSYQIFIFPFSFYICTAFDYDNENREKINDDYNRSTAQLFINWIFFILTNIIHIGIIYVLYNTINNIRLNNDNKLQPCISRIQ